MTRKRRKNLRLVPFDDTIFEDVSAFILVFFLDLLGDFFYQFRFWISSHHIPSGKKQTPLNGVFFLCSSKKIISKSIFSIVNHVNGKKQKMIPPPPEKTNKHVF